MVKEGSIVSVNYTGKLITGEIFDSSIGKVPLEFTIGSGQIIKGFENAVIGKSIGDTVTVNIQPSEAYGEIREDLLVKVPNDQLPGPVEVGQSLQAQGNDGASTINVIVKEVNEDQVIIDGNHPLAGKHLEFTIEILDVRY